MNDEQHRKEARANEKRQEAQAAADALGAFVNGADRVTIQFFVDAIVDREHRTIQQMLFGVFGQCIKRWGTIYRDDLRTEHTCRTSKLIIKRLGDVADYAFEPPHI